MVFYQLLLQILRIRGNNGFICVKNLVRAISCRLLNRFFICFRNSCDRLAPYQVVQIYFTHLSHHRYEGFESEVQGQNLSRFTETETLKTPQNSLGEM